MTVETKPVAKPPARAAASPLAGASKSSTSGRVLRLSDPELKPFMDDLKQRLRTDPEFARETLKNAGLLTPTGRLPKKYGG